MSMSLEEFVKKAYAGHDPAHGYDHAIQVLKNARIIAERIPLSADEESIFDWVMAGHDAGDHKIPVEDRLSDEQLAAIYEAQFGPELAAAIIEIHANCSWSKRKTRGAVKYETLLKILQDADWMEAVGETGLTRCIEYTTHHLRKASPLATPTEIRGLVCAHIKEKLLLIPAELNFEKSREMADLEPLRRYLSD